MAKVKINTFLWAGWLLLVTYASLATFPERSGHFIHVPHLDKGVHFLFYGVMAFLGAKAIKELWGQKVRIVQAIFFSFGFAVVYGIIIEGLQYGFTENRQGDILDILANTLGALAGIYLVYRRYSGTWPLK